MTSGFKKSSDQHNLLLGKWTSHHTGVLIHNDQLCIIKVCHLKISATRPMLSPTDCHKLFFNIDCPLLPTGNIFSAPRWAHVPKQNACMCSYQNVWPKLVTNNVEKLPTQIILNSSNSAMHLMRNEPGRKTKNVFWPWKCRAYGANMESDGTEDLWKLRNSLHMDIRQHKELVKKMWRH